MALVDEDTRAMLPTAAANMANALQTDAGWWATHHGELSARVRAVAGEGRARPVGDGPLTGGSGVFPTERLAVFRADRPLRPN